MSDINSFIIQTKQERLANLNKLLLSATHPMAIKFYQNEINKLKNEIQRFVSNHSAPLPAPLPLPPPAAPPPLPLSSSVMLAPIISARYLKNLHNIESLKYFKILMSIPKITANTQNPDAALNAFADDFGHKLYKVCFEYQRMTVVAKLNVCYESTNPQ